LKLDKLQCVAIQHVRDPSLIEVADKKYVASLPPPTPPASDTTTTDSLRVRDTSDPPSPVGSRWLRERVLFRV
jgi:hypothetical protein